MNAERKNLKPSKKADQLIERSNNIPRTPEAQKHYNQLKTEGWFNMVDEDEIDFDDDDMDFEFEEETESKSSASADDSEDDDADDAEKELKYEAFYRQHQRFILWSNDIIERIFEDEPLEDIIDYMADDEMAALFKTAVDVAKRDLEVE